MNNTEQNQASDLKQSVWVLASAGTGKTKTLIDRLLKMLLSNIDPKKILCITFTNIAANEIEYRLQKTIQFLSELNEEEIMEKINHMVDFNSNNNFFIKKSFLIDLNRKVIEAFKVYTIHAFCQNLLSKFPFESTIQYNSKVIDSIQSKTILNLIKNNIYSNSRSKIFAHIKILLKHYDYKEINSLIDEFISSSNNRAHALTLISNNEYKNNLYKYNASYKTTTETKIINKYTSSVKNIIKLNLDKCISASDTDAKILNKLYNYCLLSEQEQIQNFHQLIEVFFTAQDLKRVNLLSKNFAKNNINTYQNILDWQQLFCSFYKELKLHQYITIQYSFFIVVKYLFSEYQKYKNQEGYLDYNDLIFYTKKLLYNSSQKEWILYKLDNGFDHILVDESQDTSKEQWQIINKLIENCSFNQSNQGDKTIFIVGDPKQSIYSFQGVDLEYFEKVRTSLEKIVTQSGKKYNLINLLYNYRSSQLIIDFMKDVLDSVNLNNISNFKIENPGLIAQRKNIPSQVDLIPLINSTDLTTNKQEKNTASQICAEAIALYIKSILKKKIVLPSTKQTISETDIMILVQKRGVLYSAIIEECNKLNININSEDKIFLQNNILIKDLLCAAKFTLYPKDNFNLSCLLKSYFFNLSDALLQKIILEDNSSEYLIEKLKNSNISQAKLIYQDLLHMQQMYANKDLLGFFYIVCDALKKKLSPTINSYQINLVEEFLGIVNLFRETNENSMQKFIQWFSDNLVEIKPENNKNSVVQIMTVHGAKGLEAPCVIIADANQINLDNNKLVLSDQLCLTNFVVEPQIVQKTKEENQYRSYQEYIRLMYVAFTRCKDYLIIFGAKHNQISKFLSWYDYSKIAMQKDSIEITSKILEKVNIKSSVLSRKTNIDFSCSNKTIEKQNNNTKFNTQNNTITDLRKLENAKIDFKLFSNNSNKQINNSSNTKKIISIFDQTNLAIEEGIKVHKIIEMLVKKVEFNTIKKHYLFQSLSQSKKKQITLFFNSYIYKSIINSESVLTEVPICSKMQNSTQEVSLFRIDLMLINGNEITIIDFKTDKNAIFDKNQIPEEYILQMSRYKNIVEKLYKCFIVKTKILWLENCKYISLD